MSRKKEKYAHEKRRINRQVKNYISPEELQAIKKNSLEAITLIWDKSIATDISPKDIYQLIDAELRLQLKTPNRFILGRVQLLRFIRSKNIERLELNLPEYPEPALPKRILRAQPVKDLNWLLKGQKVAELADQAMQVWSTQKIYTAEEILGWTLFSAILWGGLNDTLALKDFFDALIERRPLYFFSELGLHFVQLDAADDGYGCHLVDAQLTRSYSFVIDDITRSWIIRLQKISLLFGDAPRTVESILNGVLAQLKTSIRYDIKHSAVLLKYASYHWELVPNVKVDQATVRVLAKQQQCCSLATPELIHFLQPDVQRGPLQLDVHSLLKGNFPKAQLTALKKTEQQVFASNVIAEIRKIFKALKNQNLISAIPRLEELASKQTFEGHARLIAWAIDLIGAEYSRKKLRGSSVMRYVDAVAKDWLILTFEEDISVYNDLRFEKIYKDMIELRAKNPGFYGPLILRFHQFQIRKYNAPQIEFDIEYGGKTCRARVVPFLVFREMCSALDSANGINQADRKLLKLILIIAYRTGLRREEIVGIEFSDLESISITFKNLCFIIRDNSSSKIKTDSAYRRIPVWALLKPAELNLLTDYLQKMRPQSKAKLHTPIFTLSISDKPLPSELPYNLVIELFNNVLKNHNYNFHAFRHTALSNLALVLDGRPELIEFFTDYTPDDCQLIKTALIGNKSNGQDRWHGLAQFAGHLSPYTTFASYLHFVHWIGGFAISQGSLQIPLEAFTNITRYDKRRILRNAKHSLNDGQSLVELGKVRSLLVRDLSAVSINLKSVSKQLESMPSSVPKIAESDSNGETAFQLPGSGNNPISMLTFVSFLQQVHDGIPVSKASATLEIERDTAEQWHRRAISLSELPTQAGQSRLFENSRFENHENPIAPFLPPSQVEQELLTMLFENAAKLHQKNPHGLHRFLDIFLDRVTATKSEIRFKMDEVDILRDFLLVGHQLVSITNWRLKAPNLNKDNEQSKIKKSLKPEESSFSEIMQSEELKRNINLFNWLSCDNSRSYNGFSLAIIHPKKDDMRKQKTTNQNFSSGLLKYACHILAIADLSYRLPSMQVPERMMPKKDKDDVSERTRLNSSSRKHDSRKICKFLND